MFDEKIAARIGHYVYRLIDPRDGATFFVGRGTGNRVFEHAGGHLLADSSNPLGAQHERVTEIINEGLSVEAIVQRHSISETAVLEVEAALIDAFSDAEHGHDGAGPATPFQLIARYRG